MMMMRRKERGKRNIHEVLSRSAFTKCSRNVPESLGNGEQLTKQSSQTNGFLISLITTFTFWTPEAAISECFTTKGNHRSRSQHNKHAKSMEGVEQVTKQVPRTVRCLASMITMLEFWTTDATISFCFTSNMNHPTRGTQHSMH